MDLFEDNPNHIQFFILGFLITVGALAYLGFFNPATYLFESCLMPGPLKCINATVDNQKIAVNIQNSAMRPLLIDSVTVYSTDNVMKGYCAKILTPERLLEFGKWEEIIIDEKHPDEGSCLFLPSASSKQRYSIIVDYRYSDSQITHTTIGNFIARRRQVNQQNIWDGVIG